MDFIGYFRRIMNQGAAETFDPSTDSAVILAPGELMTDYTSLHKVAHTINCGGKIEGGYASMIGGYPGPPEGAALAQIAGGLLQLVVHQITLNGVDVDDIRYGGNCGREGQWAFSIIYQAFSRNTHILKTGPVDQVAGPCTEMLLYESAVGVLNASVSGGAYTLFPRSGGGKYTDWLTPLECKFCAEVAKRCAGMTRKQVNEIVKVLIPKYEDMLMDPPKGKGFRECYDIKTLKPTQEWLDIYLKVKRELIELGVPLEYP